MAAPAAGPSPLFKRVCAMLDIETDKQGPMGGSPHVANLVAAPDAVLTKCQFIDVELVPEEGTDDEDEDEDSQPLTDAQWKEVAFGGDSIKLKGNKLVKEFPAPGGKGYFTIRELMSIIATFSGEDRVSEVPERVANGFGLDVHHVAFSGIEQEDGPDGPWRLLLSS